VDPIDFHNLKLEEIKMMVLIRLMENSTGCGWNFSDENSLVENFSGC
jgi:hypothetical protein